MEVKKVNYSNKIIYKNSILSVIYKIAGTCISFILSPLLLSCLGETKYGAWVSLLSIISWIYYCDFGIGNGLRNKLTECLSLGDLESSRKYLAISYVLTFQISLLICIAVFLIIHFFDLSSFLRIDFSDENMNMCFSIAISLACINFVLSLVNNVLYALQNTSLVSLFNVLGQAIFMIFLIIYSATEARLIIFIVLAEGISQLIKNLAESIYVYKKNPKLIFSIKKEIDKRYSKGILSFGIQIFIVQVAALVLNSTDNLIISRLFGSASVTPYNICYKYFNMINILYVALITPFLSAYTAAYTRKDFPWIYRSLRRNVGLYIIFIFGTIISVLIFKPFVLLWIQKELLFEKGLIFSTAFYFILLMFSHIFSTFLTGISKIKETMISTVLGTLLNIPVSVYLAKYMQLGTTGVILGSIVSIAIGIWIAPLITYRELKQMKIIDKQEQR